MITTAGNGPEPSGLESSTGICSEVPFGVVVGMDGPTSADAHPAMATHSASAKAKLRRFTPLIVNRSAARLEVLHRALAGLGLAPGPERAQIAPFTGLRVSLSRIEAVASGAELANHRVPPSRAQPGWLTTVPLLSLVPPMCAAGHSAWRAYGKGPSARRKRTRGAPLRACR